ncbi:MAG: hypothetical protein RL131_303 [Bacteroidota bacterium]
MKIIPLSEGSFTIDHTKVFVPFDPQKDKLQERPKGSLLVEIQPFLIETSNDLLLLDAGLGFQQNGVLQLFNSISDAGYSPSDVTKVLMSHLHRDHAGGLTFKDSFGNSQISFPQADHYINSKEFDFVMQGGNASYEVGPLKIVQLFEKLHLLDNEGQIGETIFYKHSGGHSPFHQVFWVKEKNEVLFFGGDEAPQLQQLKTKFIAKYDSDGKRAMELRQQWWEESMQGGWKFLFYHDIQTPIFSH